MEEIENIPNLHCLQLHDISSAEWIEQHEVLEALNLAAHTRVEEDDDSMLYRSFVKHDKVAILVRELVLIDVWKRRLLPELLERDSAPEAFLLRAYLPFYHEVLVCNLLEYLLFHEEVVASLHDSAMDLVMYIHLKLLGALNSNEIDHPFRGFIHKNEALGAESQELFAHKFEEMEKATEMCAITLLYYLIEHSEVLPLTVVTAIQETYDLLQLLVSLLEKKPWRRISGNTKEIYDDHVWKEEEEDDGVALLSKVEGHCWLSVFHLLTRPQLAGRYYLTTSRRSNILKLRKYFNEQLYDQLPPLMDLHRALETMALTDPQHGSSSRDCGVLEIAKAKSFYDELTVLLQVQWGSIFSRQQNIHKIIFNASR